MRTFITAVVACAALVASNAKGVEFVSSGKGGVHVVSFTRRETRRIFDLPGRLSVAFDGHAMPRQAVLILTTRTETCLDAGQDGTVAGVPAIVFSGKCHSITGLFLGDGVSVYREVR